MSSWTPSTFCEIRRRHASTSGLVTVGANRCSPGQLCQARPLRVLGSHGPQHMLDDVEHHEAEEDADQAIADHRGAEGRAKVLEDHLVQRESDLIAAVGEAGRGEVHPGGHGGASAEDQPEAPTVSRLGNR
jgi:hypothetical protein